MNSWKEDMEISKKNRDSAENAVSKKLIEKTECFYIDAVEEFKEAEQKIINDSQFRSIFRKKDYDGNIAILKECRKQALNIDMKELDLKNSSADTKAVAESLSQAISAFIAVCDAYVQLQVFLKKKSQKEEARFSTYKEIFNKVNDSKNAANAALHDLDIVYTDYTEVLGDQFDD